MVGVHVCTFIQDVLLSSCLSFFLSTGEESPPAKRLCVERKLRRGAEREQTERTLGGAGMDRGRGLCDSSAVAFVSGVSGLGAGRADLVAPSAQVHPQHFVRRGVRRRRASVLRLCLPGQGIYDLATKPEEVKVVVFGATGYIGRYVTKEFVRRGYDVTAFARPKSGVSGKKTEEKVREDFEGAKVVFGEVTDPESVKKAFEEGGNAGSTVVVSCLASRSGGIKDSNLIDYQATLNCLDVGHASGAGHFILLSAICVQKPLLEFQRAKLKFEAALQEKAATNDDFSFSIVRPTAFFKSLAAQVERVRDGNAFIMFNDGELSKCNAISERDLAAFIANCAKDADKRNQILPVGGPGKPQTPKEQAEMLFKLLGAEPKFVKAPIGVMDAGIGVLSFLSKFLPGLEDTAEFARIGKYYAVEDMVGPEYGSDTLEGFFQYVIENGLEGQELGAAAVFKEKQVE